MLEYWEPQRDDLPSKRTTKLNTRRCSLVVKSRIARVSSACLLNTIPGEGVEVVVNGQEVQI